MLSLSVGASDAEVMLSLSDIAFWTLEGTDVPPCATSEQGTHSGQSFFFFVLFLFFVFPSSLSLTHTVPDLLFNFCLMFCHTVSHACWGPGEWGWWVVWGGETLNCATEWSQLGLRMKLGQVMVMVPFTTPLWGNTMHDQSMGKSVCNSFFGWWSDAIFVLFWDVH